MTVLGFMRENRNIQNFKVGDYVLFKYRINHEEDKLDHIPILVAKNGLSGMEKLDTKMIVSLKELMEQSGGLLEEKINQYILRSNIRIATLDDVYKCYKTVVDNLSTEINSKASVKEEIEVKTAELQEKFNELIMKHEEEIGDHENKVIEISKKLKRFKELGFYTEYKDDVEVGGEGKAVDSEKFLTTMEFPEQQIVYIKRYLQEVKGLNYPLNIIERFYAALKTNQIIVLSGSPGTGETSLVSGFAAAIGAAAKIIPVQPNWTDQQDLMGFYNPIEKYYFSTPFLDAIIEAKGDPKRMYLICLDEMNLARVEYYFAQFLSKLQMRGKEDRFIELYSSRIPANSRSLVEAVAELTGWKFDNISNKSLDSLKAQTNVVVNYPAKLHIPSNVRFIATVNVDETTMSLSPKVVDRSFIIDFSPEEESSEVERDLQLLSQYNFDAVEKPLYVKPQLLEVLNNSEEYIQNRLSDLKISLKPLKLSLNHRFDEHIGQLWSASQWQEETFWDYIIMSKVLPRLTFTVDNEYDERLRYLEEKFLPLIKNYTLSC